MLDTILFASIGIILALKTMATAQRQTGSHMFSGLLGLFAFLFCMGMSGHIFPGVLMVAVLFILTAASSIDRQYRQAGSHHQPGNRQEDHPATIRSTAADRPPSARPFSFSSPTAKPPQRPEQPNGSR